MPPRRGRQPRARGETRMDAALDAMAAMGFERKVVRKKVNGLLEVYGGPDGWVFIEEASYKLLIDELLGGDDEPGPGPPLLTGDSSTQDNMLGDAGSSSAAGPPNTISPSMDARKNCADGNSHQDSALTLADDVSFPQQDLTNNTDNAFPPQMDHSPSLSPLEIRPPQTMPLSPPPLPPPPPPASSPSPPPPPPPPESEYDPPPPPPPPVGPTTPSSRKHRPCHGWWGDESVEIKTLPLMLVPLKSASRRPANAR